jgi:glycosyltransferase involved in cell wall biosynthesis
MQSILFTCGREPGYTRNAALQNALARNFDLVRVTDSSRSLAVRTLKVLWGLLTRRQAVAAGVVGFYGQPLMLPVRLLVRRPILFDAFLSTYETVVVERRWFSPGSPLAGLARWLDRTACALAERVLLDTQADIDYFVNELGAPPHKLRRLFVGCDETLYFPRPEIPVTPGRVLFWGSYNPLQGFDTVVRAAACLKDDRRISFRLIGGGREYGAVRALAGELGLENIEFLPFRPEAGLPAEIAGAAVALTGQFGNFEKSRRVIAGKTFQVMAMGKAPVVGDCPGNHELLTPGQDAFFVPMNDPAALAEAIRTLAFNPALAAELGAGARRTFDRRASTAVQAEELNQIILEMLNK